jgi:hypothetical protein
VDVSDFTTLSTVTEVTNRQTFKASSLTQDAGYFTAGEMIWVSGNNQNRRMEVKDFALEQITLVLPMGSDIAVGDSFNISL